MNKIKENLKDNFTVNQWNLIQSVLKGKTRSWLELAEEFNIKPLYSDRQRGKSANDIFRKYKKILNSETISPIKLPKKIKRLFYDIETSYNIVKAWRAGYNLSINSTDIIHERAIITIAYKWQGDESVTVLQWDKGCDKKLITEFLKVMQEADELVGHNIDKFDTKFIMGRALFHQLPGLPKYLSTDTLKLARRHFMLNSNKLDYIAQLLGIGSKTKHRGMAMWDDIILRNDPDALDEMIEYNVQDVFLTEEVFNRLRIYADPKVNHTIITGGENYNCPDCGSDKAKLSKTYVTKVGTKSHLMSCTCGSNFTLTDKKYKDNYIK